MTSVQDIYESNLRRQYTAADAKQFDEAEKQLAANRLDVKGPGATHNLDLIDEFFQTNRAVPVTLQNIYKAVEQRKNEFIWLSPAEAEWYRTALQNLELANQLAAYLSTQGQVGRLVNDGDQLFENLTLLFKEIHSRRESVSSQTIAAAEDRIAHRPERQLHRVPQPRRTEPQSAAAKADDGVPFLGRNLNEPEWVRRSRERSEREAAERAKQPGAAASVTVREVQRRAEELRGNTHSETEQLKKIFVTIPGTSEIDWSSTEVARLNLQKSFNKAQAVRRFIR
jgi:hypothetical protein